MVGEYKRGYLVADQEFVLGGRQAFSQMVCQQQPIDECARSHFAIAPGSRANRKLTSATHLQSRLLPACRPSARKREFLKAYWACRPTDLRV